MSIQPVLGIALRFCVLLCALNVTVECKGKEVESGVGSGRITARSQIEPYVNWLPGETESLVVLREDYTIPERRPVGRDGVAFSVVKREGLIDFLLDRPGTRQILSGKTIKLWIEGRRQFRLPGLSPIEGVINDGCHILVFADDIRNTCQWLMKRLKQTGGTQHDINGQSVVEYIPRSLRRHPHGFSYWITSPKPDVLLIATHPGFLSELLAKVVKPDKTAFPATLPEWQSISPDAAIWGIRRYPERFGESDISDVRWPDRGVTGDAAGFVFSIDEDADRATIIWFACDDVIVKRLRKSLRKRLSEDDTECAIRSETNGTVRIAIEWPDEAKKANDSDRLRIRANLASWLHWYLGHAAVL